MIDWITASLPCTHVPLVTDRILRLNSDGTIDWESPCRLAATGSWESSISIKSMGGNGQGMATHLWVSGNPSKYLQGHNVVGSDDLLGLVFDTYLDIVKRRNLTPTEDEIEDVKTGSYRISRVDINYMFELQTRQDVVAWIRTAEFTSRTRHGRPLSKGGTIYWGKHSRRWAIKAYSKAEEIEKHQLPGALKKSPLTEYVQNKLRIEVVLKQKELIEKQLDQASELAKYGAKKLYDEYVERIQMSEQIRLSDEKLHELPQRLRSTYVLWQHGEHVGSVLPKSTFFRHKKELLNFGIDIQTVRPKKNAANVVPLIRILKAEPAQIPDWAYQSGLIHGERKAS